MEVQRCPGQGDYRPTLAYFVTGIGGICYALNLTARGTGFTHPPLHSPGDCNVVGGFCFIVCFKSVAFVEKPFQCICDFFT